MTADTARPLALITGAGVRLGRATALALAQAGYDLILHANRSIEALDAVAHAAAEAGATSHRIPADLSTESGQQHLVDAVLDLDSVRDRGLSLLVHNAGLFEKIPFESVDRATYRRMQAVNLEAPYFVTQGLLPALHRGAEPSIVHLTDIAGERPLRGYSHYSVSKAGLLMLTRALAAELAPQVRVNAVSPGTVVFPEDFDDTTRAAFLRRIPLGREGSADDVARAVVFLASQPYVTGQVIAVDGGRSVVL